MKITQSALAQPLRSCCEDVEEHHERDPDPDEKRKKTGSSRTHRAPDSCCQIDFLVVCGRGSAELPRTMF